MMCTCAALCAIQRGAVAVQWLTADTGQTIRLCYTYTALPSTENPFCLTGFL